MKILKRLKAERDGQVFDTFIYFMFHIGDAMFQKVYGAYIDLERWYLVRYDIWCSTGRRRQPWDLVPHHRHGAGAGFGKYKQTVQNREQSQAVIKNPDLDNDFGRISR